MGLDFTHKKIKDGEEMAHFTYSGFNLFRERVANEIGINLREMAGFTKTKNGKSWYEVKNPVKYLLNHSDCDGDLSPEECLEVATVLESIISGWPDDDFDKQRALVLIRNMRTCHQQNVPLIFI